MVLNLIEVIRKIKKSKANVYCRTKKVKKHTHKQQYKNNYAEAQYKISGV